MVHIKNFKNKNSTIKRRYDALNEAQKKQLRLFFETRLEKPVSSKTFYRLINMSVKELRKEPVERLELFAEYFECSIDQLYEDPQLDDDDILGLKDC